MPCCIKQCRGNSQLVRFPKNVLLRNRWQDAIKAGTGADVNPMVTTNGSSQLQEICMSHFAKPEDYQYQEPTCYVTETGQQVKLASCRLCNKFEHESQMVSMAGQLCECYIPTLILQTVRIRLKVDAFSERICRECLVKVDMVRSLQKEFLISEVELQGLRRMQTPLELVKQEDDTICIEFECQVISSESEASNSEMTLEVEVDETPRSNTSSPSIIQRPITPPPATTPPVPPTENVVKRKKRVRHRPKKEKKPKAVKIRGLAHINTATGKKWLHTMKCYICSIVFGEQDELVAHLAQTHAGQMEYTCKDCDDKKFPLVTLYNYHLRLHDAQERPLKCNYCAIRYCSVDAIRSHENREHGTNHKVKKYTNIPNPSKPQCEICGKFFRTLVNVKRHKIMEHDGGYVSQCKICDKKFASLTYMKRHVLVHSAERPNVCDTRKSPTPKLLKCKICDEVRKSKTGIAWHMAKEHNMGKRHTCSTCGKIFMLKSNFMRHLQVHLEVKKFPCDFCDKTFSAKNAMQNHRRNIHTKEKPFQCHSCGIRFKDRSTYYRHRAVCETNGNSDE